MKSESTRFFNVSRVRDMRPHEIEAVAWAALSLGYRELDTGQYEQPTTRQAAQTLWNSTLTKVLDELLPFGSLVNDMVTIFQITEATRRIYPDWRVKQKTPCPDKLNESTACARCALTGCQKRAKP